MPLGNPIRKQNESRIVSVLATEGQTVFTVQGGYTINQISVFRNGVRLSNSEDFTAGDGSTVTLNNAANIDDRIEFHIFDRFTVQNAIIGAASTQTISGDLVLNGKLFGELDVPNINTGIGTFSGNIIGNNRVGIGTDDPATKLHISSGTSGDCELVIEADADNSNDNDNSRILFRQDGGQDQSAIGTENNELALYNSVSGGGIIFKTGTSVGYTNATEKVRITSAGDVGINSEAPNTRLDVIESYVNRTWTPPSSGTALFERNGENRVAIVATSKSQIDFADTDDDNVGYIRYDHSDNSMSFRTNGTDNRFRILSNGAIGIGTTGARGATVEIQDIGGTGPCLLLAGATNAEGDLAIPIDQDFNIGHWNNVDTFIQRFKIDTTGTIDIPGDVGIADTIFHIGDTNTKIRFPAADNISFETAGSERLRITSSILGINTTSESISGMSRYLSISARNVNNGGSALEIVGNRTGSDQTLGVINFVNDASNVAQITAKYQGSTTNGSLQFLTSGSERLRIDSSGRLLKGTTSTVSVGNGANTQIVGSAGADASLALIRQSAGGGELYFAAGTSGTNISSGNGLGFIKFMGYHTNGYDEYARIEAYADGTTGDGDAPGRLSFKTTADGANSGTERLRITSGGRLLVNHTSGLAPGSFSAKLSIEDVNSAASLSITRNSANNGAPVLLFGKSRGTSVGANTIVQDNDQLGEIRFYGADGTDRESFAALIKAEVDGTPGANDMPGCLIFSTTADGAVASSERMRISSGGYMGINKTNPDQEIDIKAIDQDATIRLTGNNNATIEMYADNATTNLNMYRINSEEAGGLRFQSYGTGSWSSALILYGHATDSNQAVARFGNGTVSLPAISFIDDTDSGLYRESNNDIRFAVGGSFTAKFGDGFRVMTTAGSIYNDDSTSSAGFQVDGSDRYSAVARYQGTPFFVNRMSQDGNLISFYESGSSVGNISVSGSTVSYNPFLGCHKGRLSDGSKPTILPGTILETINQSIEWKTVTISNVGSASSTIVLPYYGEKTSGIETVSYDNIEYNGTVGYSTNYQPKGDNKHVCVKVSDTASSKAVTGVFVDWTSSVNDAKDNHLDEPYNDLRVGAVGNFFIRMKSGETVAIGDLVESNGDGTGKVQSDDIIRSKTVGKITSTNVIKTYDDGSFLITAVLYSG